MNNFGHVRGSWWARRRRERARDGAGTCPMAANAPQKWRPACYVGEELRARVAGDPPPRWVGGRGVPAIPRAPRCRRTHCARDLPLRLFGRA